MLNRVERRSSRPTEDLREGGATESKISGSSGERTRDESSGVVADFEESSTSSR